MNYSDQILENKTFNFFKQLMYNLALALCLMLVGVLILVYGFKYQLYEVLSDSQYPYFKRGDMVIVKEASEYKEGDIVKFMSGALPTTHRLIAIFEENGKTYYICHGDAVGPVSPDETADTTWQQDVEYINNLYYGEDGVHGTDDYTLDEILNGIQVDGVKETIAQELQVANKIEGKVVNHIDNYGTYFKYIKDHYMLLIAIIAAIWCFSTTVQNEIDMKKSKRLM
ncbi:MAG: hypothetical protein E7351_01005 [Clostridiales bacterium]|nr:hypothetical protein [Clostridiales bacterium]